MLLGSTWIVYRTINLLFAFFTSLTLLFTALELSANTTYSSTADRKGHSVDSEHKAHRRAHSEIDKIRRARTLVKNDSLPLYFVRNDGQFEPHVKFYALQKGILIYFTEEGVYFSFNSIEGSEFPYALLNNLNKGLQHKKLLKQEKFKIIRHVVEMRPVGSSDKLLIQGEGLEKAKFNYFVGNNSKKWRTNIPTFRAVVYKNVYPGIDLKFYGNDSGELEYDVVVKPWSNPSKIRFAYEGIENLNLDLSGNLIVQLCIGNIIQRKPHIFQEIENKTLAVEGHFQIYPQQDRKRHLYGFDISTFDRKLALTIDPVISYSTYLGGAMDDFARAIDIDGSGSVYVTGLSLSFDFPLTPGAYQTTTDGVQGFITKLSADGTSFIYSTYLGGSNVDDCVSIKVDGLGNAYVACRTESTDYPTLNPFQSNLLGGGDVAVTKLNSDGSALLYSTYLGGSAFQDYPSGISLDSNENAYIAGITFSSDFPLMNPLQPEHGGGTFDGFVTKLNAAGDSLVYSTYLGGVASDDPFGIAVDSSGSAYVTGATNSPNFPTTFGAVDTICDNDDSCDDAFVSKIASNGQNLTYSTFLGGSSIDDAYAIAVDSAGSAYVTGHTLSDDFPIINAAQPSPNSLIDAFVTKISTDGSSLIYSTYLGGNDNDTANAIAVDSSGAAYVTGREESTDFPTRNALPIECGLDAFVTRVAVDGSDWEYSTCLGGSFYDEGYGIIVNGTGAAYVAGYSLSPDFPVKNAAQPNHAGGFDGFITKLVCDLIESPSVLENSGSAVFNVRLCIPRSSNITINYSTSDGTASAGDDYVSVSGPLIIPAGSVFGSIDVPLIDDSNLEPDETFFLDVSSTDIDLGLSQVAGTILDNDGFLFDDFEDGVMTWDVLKGEWIENAGSLIGTALKTAMAFAPVPWSPSGVQGCSICTIETSMQTAGGNFNRIMLEAWYQDNANKVELILKEEVNKWLLRQRVNGAVVAKSRAARSIDPGVNYNIVLSFDGSNFILRVDGIQILTMPAAAAPFGKVGFKAKKTTGTFGHIRVY